MTTIDAGALEPLETQCEWRRDDLADGYVFQLTDAHVAELDAALRARGSRDRRRARHHARVVPAADARARAHRSSRTS